MLRENPGDPSVTLSAEVRVLKRRNSDFDVLDLFFGDRLASDIDSVAFSLPFAMQQRKAQPPRDGGDPQR
jgi:hypothetical protein